MAGFGVTQSTPYPFPIGGFLAGDSYMESAISQAATAINSLDIVPSVFLTDAGDGTFRRTAAGEAIVGWCVDVTDSLGKPLPYGRIPSGSSGLVRYIPMNLLLNAQQLWQFEDSTSTYASTLLGQADTNNIAVSAVYFDIVNSTSVAALDLTAQNVGSYVPIIKANSASYSASSGQFRVAYNIQEPSDGTGAQAYAAYYVNT